ncbi:hypothetical protein [Pseudomonas sp. EA_65y_Pfl1_P120]|uniref:hypothetical protein n=1 Tax=Pseudomonas sp. EA_65y_Pfl1_P120 TaxID=3088693 RepID=UPI0030D823C4
MTLSAHLSTPSLAHFVPLAPPLIQAPRLSLSALQTDASVQPPSVDGDRQLAELYVNSLRTHSDKPWSIGDQPIGPIPPDSTFGQWRQQLSALLQSPDLKDWAQKNRIDLSKPFSLFPPQGNTPGFAALRVKPLAGARSQSVTSKYFGSFVGDRSHALPLSWSLIMQAAAVLANGQTYIVAPRGDMAQVKEVAAFYGEALPTTVDAANDRAAQLEQQNVFAGSAHLNHGDALEHQKTQMADVNNRHTFSNQIINRVLAAFVALYLDAQEKAQLPPGSVGYISPDQFKARVKNDLEQLLGVITLPIDPHSPYYRDQGLAAAGSASLKRFIEDNGWMMPTTLAELRNLATSTTAAAPLSPPHGNLGGALSWPLPPSHQDQLSSYQPLAMLPGAKYGLFRQLTSKLVLDRSTLAQPRRVIESIINSTEGQRVGTSLEAKFAGLSSETSVADWLLTALQLSLDQETLLDRSGAPSRNKVAGFDLAHSEHVGKHPSTVVTALSDHLEDKQKATAELAPVAAYLLLSRRAPAYLVKDIPAGVTCGSHSWVSLEVAVARLEAKAPGSTALMTYAQVITLAERAPITVEDRMVAASAQQAALMDWGIANGVITANAKDEYAALQMDSVRTAYNAQLEELSAGSQAFSREMPARRALALGALKKAFGEGIDFEKQSLEAVAKGRDDVGPHSVVDIYMNGGFTGALGRGWTSNDPSVPINRLNVVKDLPDINVVFAKAFAVYAAQMEKAMGAQVKHLIATLPLEARKNIEQGTLETFKQVQVSTDNYGETKRRTLTNRTGLLIRTERQGVVTVYEINLEKNTLSRRDDLKNVVPGAMVAPYRAGFSVSEYPRVLPKKNHAATVKDETASDSIPNSFNSDRTAYIADALVSHADIRSFENQARGQTTFDTRLPWYKHASAFVVNFLPLYPAIKSFQAGDIGAGIVDLAFDAFGFMVGLGAAAKAAKGVQAGVSSLNTLGRLTKVFGRTAMSTLNPLDAFANLVALPLKGLQKGAVGGYKLLAGSTDSYELLKAGKNVDASSYGTFKFNNDFIEGPAVLKQDKWYAYNPITQQPYGSPLKDFLPAARIEVDHFGAWTRASDPTRRIDEAMVNNWKRVVGEYRSGPEKTRFDDGYTLGDPKIVEKLSSTSSIEDIMRLATKRGMTAEQIGVLVRRYDDIAYGVGKSRSTRFINRIEPRFGNVVPVPQVVYFSQTAQLSDGQCAALSRAMATAMAHGKEKTLIKNLYTAAAFPADPASRRFIERLRKLQAQVGGETSFHAGMPIRQVSYQNMVKELDAATASKSLMIDSPNHAMAAGVRIENGQKNFYFYDPNLGVATFPSADAMEAGLKKVFHDKKLGPHYKTHSTDANKLEFKVFDHDDAWQARNSVFSADFKTLYEDPIIPSGVPRSLSHLELKKNWEVLHTHPANKGLICYRAALRVGQAERTLSTKVYDAVLARMDTLAATNYSPSYLDIMGIKPDNLKTTFNAADIKESGLINFKHANDGGDFGHTVYVQKTKHNELFLFNTNSPDLDVAMIRHGNPPQVSGGMTVYHLDKANGKGLQAFLDGFDGKQGWQFAFTPASVLNANVQKLSH